MKTMAKILSVFLVLSLCFSTVSIAEEESPFSMFPEVKWGMHPNRLYIKDQEFVIRQMGNQFIRMIKPFILDDMVSSVEYVFKDNSLNMASLSFAPFYDEKEEYLNKYKEIYLLICDQMGEPIFSSLDWDTEDVSATWIDEKGSISISITFGGTFGIGYLIIRTRNGY